MNIIIPIGGIGQRFKEEGFDLPKPLINVLGKPMIRRVIDSLKLDHTDTIFIAYNAELDKFNFEQLIAFYFPKINFQFVPLKQFTRGATQTVHECLQTMTDTQLAQGVLVVDCDTFYEDDVIGLYKSGQQRNVIYYSYNTEPSPIYSYIEIDSQGEVQDIKEKVKISHNANVGVYGFESGKLLQQYAAEVLQDDGELYISRIYAKMLQSSEQVTSQLVKNYHCVGTPLQLKMYSNANKHLSEQLRICFDLDNTLVSYPETVGDYSTVKPITRNIEFAKLLKQLGHTIIIHTARRMKTHKGNVGGIVADVGAVTIATLDKFNIPYDEIYFGKPYANFYIDDLAVPAYTNLSKAIGVFNTDVESRSVNEVSYTEDFVTKQTHNPGEVQWYANIPQDVVDIFPKVFDIFGNTVVMERVKGVCYSHLYVEKALTKQDVDMIFEQLQRIHTLDFEQPEGCVYANYGDKVVDRYTKSIDLYKNIPRSSEAFAKIITGLTLYKDSGRAVRTVTHGDPVLTNIIKTETGLKFIDMKGMLGPEVTMQGDSNYDYAKLYQSLIGYDFILHDASIDANYTNTLIKHFESKFSTARLMDIRIITASLLFTMLPFHDFDAKKFERYIDLIYTLL